MSDAADLRPSTRCARRCTSRKIILCVLLGIALTVIIVFFEHNLLRKSPQRMSDNSSVVTWPWNGTQSVSLLDTTRLDEVQYGTLRWRVQNQARRYGQPRWDTENTGWHPRRIDISEFIELGPIQAGRLELVRHPHFGAPSLLVKITDEHEAMIYRLLYNLNVTPSFLGHVTMDGKIIGFVTEFVQRTGNLPTLGTLSRREACLAALRRLHGAGIAHRDAHGENCLLRDDGSAALIDFELSAVTSSPAELDRDLWIMYHTVLD